MTNSQACLFAFVALTIGAVFAPSFGGTAFLSILAVGVIEHPAWRLPPSGGRGNAGTSQNKA